jgi:hypothetical protein
MRTAQSVTKQAAQRVYRERVPHYPLPLSAVPAAGPRGPIGPIAQRSPSAAARFIATDTRSERSPRTRRRPQPDDARPAAAPSGSSTS